MCIRDRGRTGPCTERLLAAGVAEAHVATLDPNPELSLIHISYGGGTRAPELHSDSPETLFSHMPGLRVVVPSDPLSAGELLLAATRCGDPVVFLEPKRMYRRGRQLLPAKFVPGELDHAVVVRPGEDLTVIAYGAMVDVAEGAAERLQEEGVSTRVLDLRSIYPLDRESILAAAEETGDVYKRQEHARAPGLRGRRWLRRRGGPES